MKYLFLKDKSNRERASFVNIKVQCILFYNFTDFTRVLKIMRDYMWLKKC